MLTHQIASGADLASIKSNVDDLDINKLKTISCYLYKLTNAVEKEILKKHVYDQLVKKVIVIQTINTSDLIKEADYNTKINEIEKKIPDHDKLITALEFNQLTAEDFASRLKHANFESKNYIADFVKEADFAEKLKRNNTIVTSIKTRYVEAEKKINDLLGEVKLI